MNGQPIGHVRVSNFEQNPERQLEYVPVDKVFAAKAAGKCWAFALSRAAGFNHWGEIRDRRIGRPLLTYAIASVRTVAQAASAAMPADPLLDLSTLMRQLAGMNSSNR